MGTIIESLALAFILILIVLLIGHLLSGDALEWIQSKFKAGEATT